MAFSLDGNLVYSKNYEPQDFGAMTFAVKEGFLTYYGYGTTNNHRFALIDDEKKTFLVPSKEKVINYTPPSSVFSAIKDSVFIIDSYSNEIKIYKDREVNPYIGFDFGKYSIPAKFYEFEDPFMAADFLLEREFALITAFYTDYDNKYVRVVVHKQPRSEIYHGLFLNSRWSWFYAGVDGEDILANSFKGIKDGLLYCV